MSVILLPLATLFIGLTVAIASGVAVERAHPGTAWPVVVALAVAMVIAYAGGVTFH